MDISSTTKGLSQTKNKKIYKQALPNKNKIIHKEGGIPDIIS